MSEFSYQKPVRFMDKLSQYIKEKGSFGDLSLAMACNTEPSATATPTTTTMNLFPQQSGFVSKEVAPKMADSRVGKAATVEPKTAQMTIFYAGKVIVLDDLPADKAKEVMLFASKGRSINHNSFASTLVKTPAEVATLNPPSPIVPNSGNNLIQENTQRASPPVVCDLPIARRASLHRFLEKRKDRITAKPYQSNSQAEESKPWMGLAGQSPFRC